MSLRQTDTTSTSERRVPAVNVISGCTMTCCAVAFCGLILAGCGEEPVPQGTAGPDILMAASNFSELFDSIRVAKPEQDPEEPIVRISGLDWTEQAFAIADVSEGNAKLFDATGKRLAIMGRRGEGPGEFRGPRYPQIIGDKLVVADGATSRLSTFDFTGAFVSDIPLRVGYMSDFVRLPDGRFVVAGNGLGSPEANMATYSADGELLAAGLYTDHVLPRGADPDFPWSNLRQAYLTTSADTAWAVSTISDTLWSVPLSGTNLVATARRLVIPGYVPATLPEERPRTPRELDEWAKGFHGAAPPVASEDLIAIPFVQGVLNYGDPMILVLRDPEGTWHALSGAPPIVAAFRDLLVGINNPLEDEVELVVFRYRRP